MRTIEECYEYVLKRCDELAAQRRRKRELALKAAAPVCGIAVIAGAAAIMHSGKTNTGKYVSSADNSIISVDASSDTVQKTDSYAGLKLEFKQIGIADRIVFTKLSQLENFSDIAVVGTFIDDAEQEIKYEYNPTFEKDIVIDVQSTNTIKVSKVLMGDGVTVGDELKIDQRYGVADGKLITLSELTPMQKGDEWVFFLRKRTESDHYICSADSDSRFPTKNSASKNIKTALAKKSELGVYDEADFNRDIYNEIVAKYDV